VDALRATREAELVAVSRARVASTKATAALIIAAGVMLAAMAAAARDGLHSHIPQNDRFSGANGQAHSRCAGSGKPLSLEASPPKSKREPTAAMVPFRAVLLCFGGRL
jgi:hypothetical protein